MSFLVLEIFKKIKRKKMKKKNFKFVNQFYINLQIHFMSLEKHLNVNYYENVFLKNNC